MATDKQLYKGHYEEAEKTFDNYQLDAADVKSRDLIRTCHIYFKLKKYNRFFECVEKLEGNIARGDNTISSVSGLLSPSPLFPSEISVVPHLMKAEAFLDTGNYKSALVSAEKAYTLADAMSIKDKINNWDRRSRIQALSILVMGNALSGNKEQALRHLKILESQGIGFSTGYQVNKEKKLALSRAYMSLGMYEKVLSSFSFGDLASFLVDLSSLGFLNIDAVRYNVFGYVELPQEFSRYKALFETGKIVEAKKGYSALLKNPATSTNGEIFWVILYDMGRIAELESNHEEALIYYRKAIDIIESQRSTINTEASKIGFVGDKQKVYSSLIFALASAGRTEEAFEYVERSKSRALVDQLASITEFKATDTRAAMLISDLKQNEIDMAAYRFDTDENESGQRAIQIRRELNQRYSDLSSLVTVKGISVAEIARYLQDEETLLEYYYADNRLIAFVLHKGKIRSIELPWGNLAELTSVFRRHILQHRTTEYLVDAGKLHAILMAPLEPYLTTRTIIIVPHGALHYLPFNALTDGHKTVLERYDIAFLPSASTYRYLIKEEKTKSESILVLGNPDLGDPRYALEFAEQEALAIGALFEKSSIFIKDTATESLVKKRGGAFDIIHFATHGTFDSSSPLESALYLVKDIENDGLLTVKELYALNLKADLVTLSACETGLGSIKPGDDVIGLQRGFLYAGARSIIASLWKVDDAATSEMMIAFYKNLKTQKKLVALREAQREVKKTYQHPYYWAAFQFTGLP